MPEADTPQALSYPMTPEQVENLDLMLRELYNELQRRNADGSAHTETPTPAQTMARTVLGL